MSTICGRCGTTNPDNGEFCVSCGALMAAYVSPSGSVDSAEFVAPPVEAVLVQQTVTIPSTPPTPKAEPVTLQASPPDEIIDVEFTEVAAPESTDPETNEAPEEVAHEPAPALEPEPEPEPATPTWAEAAQRTAEAKQTSTLPADASTMVAAAEELPASPFAQPYRSLYGQSTAPEYQPSWMASRATSSPSPQTLILIGAAVLGGICVTASVASSGTWFLLIGGPLAICLIVIGIFIMIGRYPTGRQ